MAQQFNSRKNTEEPTQNDVYEDKKSDTSFFTEQQLEKYCICLPQYVMYTYDTEAEMLKNYEELDEKNLNVSVHYPSGKK